MAGFVGIRTLSGREGCQGRPPDKLLRVRTEYSAPLFAEWKAWLEITARWLKRSLRAVALECFDAGIARRPGCIDNSVAERAMRPVPLERRNWTFAGSDAGGELAAAFYSVIETAKRHDPEAYLTDVLERIASYPANRVHELLPWNVSGIKRRLDQRLAA